MEGFLDVATDVAPPPPGGGHISRNKLSSRFEAFNRGEWIRLIEASIVCDAKAAQSRRRQQRRGADDVEQRAIRAETLVESCPTPGKCWRARTSLQGIKQLWMSSETSHADQHCLVNLSRKS